VGLIARRDIFPEKPRPGSTHVYSAILSYKIRKRRRACTAKIHTRQSNVFILQNPGRVAPARRAIFFCRRARPGDEHIGNILSILFSGSLMERVELISTIT
jgi:hypothetical protein